jgi:hypothetical protein
VSLIDRESVIAAAQQILEQGGWCVFDVCIDVPEQNWESRALIFDLSPAAVADAVEREIEYEPGLDARLSGCDRRTLGPIPGVGYYLCYLADTPPLTASVLANATNASTLGRAGPTAERTTNHGRVAGP